MFFMRKCLIYTVNISIRMTERIVQIRILILMFNVFFIIAPLFKKKKAFEEKKEKEIKGNETLLTYFPFRYQGSQKNAV